MTTRDREYQTMMTALAEATRRRDADLAPLHPQPGGPAWYPRRRRGLFFDRSVHRTPEVIIPYEVNSDHT